jgi:hypothetical protein
MLFPSVPGLAHPKAVKGGGAKVRCTKVKGSDEESVYALYGGNAVYVVESFLGLDLHDGQEALVGLLEVLSRGYAKVDWRVRRAEASPAPRGKFGSLDKSPGLICCP